MVQHTKYKEPRPLIAERFACEEEIPLERHDCKCQLEFTIYKVNINLARWDENPIKFVDLHEDYMTVITFQTLMDNGLIEQLVVYEEPSCPLHLLRNKLRQTIDTAFSIGLYELIIQIHSVGMEWVNGTD